MWFLEGYVGILLTSTENHMGKEMNNGRETGLV